MLLHVRKTGEAGANTPTIAETSPSFCRYSTIVLLWAGSTRENSRAWRQASRCCAGVISSNSRPENDNPKKWRRKRSGGKRKRRRRTGRGRGEGKIGRGRRRGSLIDTYSIQLGYWIGLKFCGSNLHKFLQIMDHLWNYFSEFLTCLTCVVRILVQRLEVPRRRTVAEL